MGALSGYWLLDPEVIEDPYPFYGALLREAPVYRVPGAQVYLVAPWALVHEVLRNDQDYSANLTGILVTGEGGAPELFDLRQFGGTVDAIANADEPSHSVHRRLVMPQVHARRVAALEEEVRDWARAGVARLCAAGQGDCVGELANPIPVQVMARLVGLPLDDVERLLGWAFAGGDILAGTTTVARMLEIGAATAELSAYLRGHFAAALERCYEPPGTLAEELALGVRDGLVTEQEAIGILVVLVGAAGESTSSLVGSAIRLLAQDAALQQRLRQQPALIDAFVEEVVRLESPFRGHYRVVLNDTSLGGVELPTDSRVLLLWAAANRDPAVFADPDALDIARADIGEHLGFGYGIHFCIGARVARMEARIILEELLGQTREFSIDTGSPLRHVPSIFVRRLTTLNLQLTA